MPTAPPDWTRPALLALLLALAGAGRAEGQAQVVPAEHPVYEWLATQRTAGRLPEFDAEILPTGRRTVRAHLDSLAVRDSAAVAGGAGRGRLGASERFWLGEFRREFFEPLDAVHSYVGDGRAGVLDPDAERTLGYFRDDDWRALVVGEGAVQARAAEGVGGESLDAGGVARQARLTFAAEWRSWLGLYTSTLSGFQMTGNTAVLRSDPALASTYYVSRDPDNVFGAFDRTTASLRARAGPFSAEIANERLIVGASVDAPLHLSANADYLPFVRLGLHTSVVDVQAVHAALSTPSEFVVGDGDNRLESPERYLALTRLRVRPVSWLSLAFTEMAVYGLRGPELAYLNPLFPVKAAEHALYDRDNTLFSLEGVLRPARGVELYGTWFVDDLATGELGDARFSNKWAMNAGGSLTLPVTGATAFAEYVRVEPYTYSHRFQADGVFYNGYTHNGFGLGHPIGPNADQWLAGVEAWLPARVRARGLVRYRRRGENPVDPETGEIVQVGGDVLLGTAPPDGSKAFLGGDRFEGWGLQGGAVYEPLNGVELSLFGDLQRWGGAPDEAFLRAELAVRL